MAVLVLERSRYSRFSSVIMMIHPSPHEQRKPGICGEGWFDILAILNYSSVRTFVASVLRERCIVVG